MVNNIFFRAWAWTFFTLMLFFLPGLLQAQKINRHYTSSLQPSGMLYYIKPQSLCKAAAGQSRMVTDITYLSRTDSATINFSLFDKNSIELRSVGFGINGSTVKMPVKKLYVESRRGDWHYRYAMRIAYKDLREFYRQKVSPAVVLETSAGSEQMTPTAKKWKKISGINSRIFQLIEMN